MRAPWAPWAGLAVCAIAGFASQSPAERALGRFATSLDGRTRNQRHNARLAVEALHGTVIEPGAEFSFNRRVGTWSRDAGYRKAPVSFNGQLVASWGGGVCQASTTFYNAALLSGLDILERNPHHHAPTYCPPGRDAAVAFSGIDLRVRNPHPFRVRVEAGIERDSLVVAIVGPGEVAPAPRIVTEIRGFSRPGSIQIGERTDFGRLRNGGKAGFEVATYRQHGNRKQLVSTDSYPPMSRIIEYR